MLPVEPWSPEHTPLFTQLVWGPSIAHSLPAVTGTPAFWVPLSLSPYLYPSVFISACVYTYLSVCLFFPPCVLSHFILIFLARLSPLFFYLPNFVFFCISLSLSPFRPYSPPFLFLISFLHSLLYVVSSSLLCFPSFFLSSSDCDFRFA